MKILNNQKTLLVSLAVLAAAVSFGAVFGITKSDAVQSNCQDICVSLKEDKAQPDTLSVPVGSFVQFNSADGNSHNLSVGTGGEEHSHQGKFHSGEFQADEAWKAQFNEEGSFFFHDHLNPKINVLIVVYTPGKDYKIK